jgi:hypothetical protein
MSPPASLRDGSASGGHATVQSTSWLAKVHPYFKDPGHVLVLKLDCLLLVWAFIAGLFKVFPITKWFYLSGADVF